MKIAIQNAGNDRGFALIEIMIAAVVMAVVMMGLLSSLSGAFLAANTANEASESQAMARRLLEEATELSYGGLVELQNSALVTEGGLAAKYQVYETAVGLLVVEVEVCRPATSLSADQVAAMTMSEFHTLNVVTGSRVRFTTLSIGTVRTLGAGSTEGEESP